MLSEFKSSQDEAHSCHDFELIFSSRHEMPTRSHASVMARAIIERCPPPLLEHWCSPWTKVLSKLLFLSKPSPSPWPSRPRLGHDLGSLSPDHNPIKLVLANERRRTREKSCATSRFFLEKFTFIIITFRHFILKRSLRHSEPSKSEVGRRDIWARRKGKPGEMMTKRVRIEELFGTLFHLYAWYESEGRNGVGPANGRIWCWRYTGCQGALQ